MTLSKAALSSKEVPPGRWGVPRPRAALRAALPLREGFPGDRLPAPRSSAANSPREVWPVSECIQLRIQSGAESVAKPYLSEAPVSSSGRT